jgi:hypothetical protein
MNHMQRYSYNRYVTNDKYMHVVEGTMVGIDSDMYVLVRVHGLHDSLRIHASNFERVSLGLLLEIGFDYMDQV